MRKFKEYKEDWQLICESPIDESYVGNILVADPDNNIYVGVYNKDMKTVDMADGFGIPVEELKYWKPVNESKEYTAFPANGETVLCELGELGCLVIGMFTDRFDDEETGERVKVVILDPIYEFEGEETTDIVIDWSNVLSWYRVTPLKEIRDICVDNYVLGDCVDDEPCEVVEEPEEVLDFNDVKEFNTLDGTNHSAIMNILNGGMTDNPTV